MGRRLVIGGLVLVLLAAAAVWGIKRLTGPPDVAATARSAPVVEAGRLAMSKVDGRIAMAAGLEPRLVAVASDVEDRCDTERAPFVGQGYGPVVCTRAVTTFYAFDGDPVAAGRSWYDKVRQTGWRNGPPATRPPEPATFTHPEGVVTVRWSKCPDAPDVVLGGKGADSELRAYRADEPVDVGATVRQICGRSGYVTVIASELRYFDAEA